MCNILLRARAKFIECIKTEELRCTIMTIESESKVNAMHKNERIETQFANMMVENTLKV